MRWPLPNPAGEHQWTINERFCPDSSDHRHGREIMSRGHLMMDNVGQSQSSPVSPNDVWRDVERQERQ